jgi:hypothetical protein
MAVLKKAPQKLSSNLAIRGLFAEETFLIFQSWDSSVSTHENLSRVKATNLIGAPTRNWLEEVTESFKRRYDPASDDKALVYLAQKGLGFTEWRMYLLWHVTRRDTILAAFLKECLSQLYDQGRWQIETDDGDLFLLNFLRQNKEPIDKWTPTTRRRMAHGLIKSVTDLGWLKGKVHREFASLHLDDKAFLYILYALHDQGLTTRQMIESPEWKLFRLSVSDVERELLRLHQYQKLQFEIAGSLMQLKLQHTHSWEFLQEAF